MVKEYKVIREENMFNLSDKVNTLIKDGWQPIGGAFVSYGFFDDGGYEPERAGKANMHFYQSLVR